MVEKKVCEYFLKWSLPEYVGDVKRTLVELQGLIAAGGLRALMGGAGRGLFIGQRSMHYALVGWYNENAKKKCFIKEVQLVKHYGCLQVPPYVNFPTIHDSCLAIDDNFVFDETTCSVDYSPMCDNDNLDAVEILPILENFIEFKKLVDEVRNRRWKSGREMKEGKGKQRLRSGSRNDTFSVQGIGSTIMAPGQIVKQLQGIGRPLKLISHCSQPVAPEDLRRSCISPFDPKADKSVITVVDNTNVIVDWHGRKQLLITHAHMENYGVAGQTEYEVKVLASERFKDKLIISLSANGHKVEIDVNYEHEKITGLPSSKGYSMWFCNYMYIDENTSSKVRFKRELHSIKVELPATDPTEMGLDVFSRDD
ncbi:hypothetical protein AgCh_022945 [Apium graveolens]